MVSDSFDPTTGVHTNPRTIYLDDHEEHPKSVAELADFLASEDVVAEKMLEVDGEDALEHLKATLDALEQDDSKEAETWKAKRLAAK